MCSLTRGGAIAGVNRPTVAQSLMTTIDHGCYFLPLFGRLSQITVPVITRSSSILLSLLRRSTEGHCKRRIHSFPLVKRGQCQAIRKLLQVLRAQLVALLMKQLF